MSKIYRSIYFYILFYLHMHKRVSSYTCFPCHFFLLYTYSLSPCLFLFLSSFLPLPLFTSLTSSSPLSPLPFISLFSSVFSSLPSLFYSLSSPLVSPVLSIPLLLFLCSLSSLPLPFPLLLSLLFHLPTFLSSTSCFASRSCSVTGYKVN